MAYNSQAKWIFMRTEELIVLVQYYQYLKREYQAEMASFVYHPRLQDMTSHAA